ncbi:hypothetical protein [Candidatus Lokiarchaeum ossiferum]|uniref:hypothetical protein n=1 Tax=Candidatus Lokiarchaeum ossiferum TaxID=2951803 RepID=UPI00352FE942
MKTISQKNSQLTISAKNVKLSYESIENQDQKDATIGICQDDLDIWIYLMNDCL